MKKVLVTGGRDFTDEALVHSVLNAINPDIVVQGEARGVDTFAKTWAKKNNKKVICYDPDWKNISNPDAKIKYNNYGAYDANAGLRRNILMLEENPDSLVIAFEGGTGTEHCFSNAVARKMATVRFQGYLLFYNDSLVLSSDQANRMLAFKNSKMYQSGWYKLQDGKVFGPLSKEELDVVS